jgi:hypothetical protein
MHCPSLREEHDRTPDVTLARPYVGDGVDKSMVALRPRLNLLTRLKAYVVAKRRALVEAK